MKVGILGTTFRFAPEPEGCYAVVDPAADDLVEAISTTERFVTEFGYDAVLLPFNPALDCGERRGLGIQLDEMVLASDFSGALVIVPTVSQASIESLVDTLLRLRNEIADIEMPSFTVAWGFSEKDMLRALSACGFIPLTYSARNRRAIRCGSDGVSVHSEFGGLSLSVLEIAVAAANDAGMDLSEVLENAVAATTKKSTPFGFAEGV